MEWDWDVKLNSTNNSNNNNNNNNKYYKSNTEFLFFWIFLI